jgi:hypothetical protein
MATPIKDIAAKRLAALKAQADADAKKKKGGLLNAINAATLPANSGPKTQQSADLSDRVDQEQQLKGEVGGRR